MFDSLIKFFIRLGCVFIFDKEKRKLVRKKLFDNIQKKQFFAKYKNSYNKNTFFCIGDSHTDVFSCNTYSEKVHLAPDLFSTIFTGNIHSAPEFITFHLDAVLAYSLNRYDTKNKGTEKIEWLINNGFIPENCKLVTIFGEPDCRVHIKKQAERQNRTIDSVVDDVIKNYGEFLIKMKDKGYQIYVWSPIASQKGNMEVDPVFRRYTSETERNEILKIFESKMSEFCKQNNLKFVSILSELLNDDNTSKGEYYLPDGVHLNDKGRELVLNAFSKIEEQ